MVYVIRPRSNELYHYGVLGMHWGVRKDDYHGVKGPAPYPGKTYSGKTSRIATGEAERRMAKKAGKAYKETIVGGQGGKAKGTETLAAKASNPIVDKALDRDEHGIKRGKDKEKDSPAEAIIRGTRDAARESKNVVDFAEKHDSKLKAKKQKAEQTQMQKAKKMSDKELRDSINRIKMEREYVSLTQKETKSGYDKAKEVLEVVGDVASIALTLIGIAVAVKKLKHSDIEDPELRNELDVLCHSIDLDEEFISHAMALDEDYVDDYLEHHGIKGQKWGVRRFQNPDGTRIGTAKQKPGEKRASEMYRNSIVGGQGGKAKGTERLAASAGGTKVNVPSIGSAKHHRKAANVVQRDADDLRKAGYNEEADAVQKVADKHREIADKKDKVRDESKFTPEQKRISKDAKKDAEEFARAKAFYGEGAGNRRKAIKTTVEAKKKKNSFYGEEFEYHLSQQDMEEHMRKAKMERSQRDTAKNTRSALRKTNRALGQLSRYL